MLVPELELHKKVQKLEFYMLEQELQLCILLKKLELEIYKLVKILIVKPCMQ